MRITDFLPATGDWQPPLSPAASATVQLPQRPPGRGIFPVLDGVQLKALPGSSVHAIAAGEVLAVEPRLAILHDGNVVSCYRWRGPIRARQGAPVAAGAELGKLAADAGEAILHFEVGLTLFAPNIDDQHFMPFDPRPVLGETWNVDGSLWRGTLPLSVIPLFLRRAIVAIEDRRFYRHIGIDPASIAKTAFINLRQRRIVAGASTITQQAARSALRMTRRSLLRKLVEIPIALALERFHDKDRILELYFNSIYWGRGATTVAAAAADFFGKNVWELNFKECALLAALPNQPLKWQLSAADENRLLQKCMIVLEVLRMRQVVDDLILSLVQSQPYALVRYDDTYVNDMLSHSLPLPEPVTIIPRAAWGARPPHHDAKEERGLFDPLNNPGGWQRYTGPLLDVLTTVVVHHSALDPEIGAAAIQRLHIEKRHFADIAYHFVVDATGRVYEGRPIDVRGAHVEGANTGSVGVVLLGNFQYETPPTAQLNGLHNLLADLRASYPRLTHLAGHGEFNPDSVCPGAAMQRLLTPLADYHGFSRGIGGYRRPNWAR